MVNVFLFLGALLLTIIIGRVLLPVLINLKVKQSIRQEGPQKHLAKAGTPTMGGLIFIAAALICCLFLIGEDPLLWVWLFSFLAFGLIGFLDDYAKLRHHENKGLSGKQKLAAQFVAVAVLLLMNEFLLGRGTVLDFFGAAVDLGWFYYLITAVFVVGMVNAVNLTDGLDGLASGVSFFTFAGFVVIGLALAGLSASYQLLPNLAMIMAGCCLGFLFYNRYPAKVFMGDTGSLALGGFVTALAFMLEIPLFLVIVGLIYVAEALSVILQVGYFKLTKGKRIFKMAPLHHHFELCGWSETKVVAVFSIITAMLCLVGLLLV